MGLIVTLILAVAFTGFQVFEYIGANWNQSVFTDLLSLWQLVSMDSMFLLEQYS